MILSDRDLLRALRLVRPDVPGDAIMIDAEASYVADASVTCRVVLHFATGEPKELILSDLEFARWREVLREL